MWLYTKHRFYSAVCACQDDGSKSWTAVAASCLLPLVLVGCTSNYLVNLHPVPPQQGNRGFDKVVVRGVLPNSPVERSGLRLGDEIVAIDSIPIRSAADFEKLKPLLLEIRFDIRRHGVDHTISARRRRNTDLWGLFLACLDARGRPVPVVTVTKVPGKAPGQVHRYDGTSIGAQAIITLNRLLVVHVMARNPTNAALSFSIQDVRVMNGDRVVLWPIPAGEAVARLYAGVVDQPQAAYLPKSAVDPSYTATTFSRTTVSNGYMQTYGTTYMTPQDNPYNSFVDGYNLGTAIRNNTRIQARANMQRDLVTFNELALKTTTVPPLGAAEGNIYFWLEQHRKPYFVQLEFNGQKVVVEFDDKQFIER